MIRELWLIVKIWRWHDRTFKDLPMSEQRNKLKSEIDEFNEAKAKFIKSPYPRRHKYIGAMNDELTDVIIASINCLKYPDFYERVAVKHNINIHRTWKGTHHVSAK